MWICMIWDGKNTQTNENKRNTKEHKKAKTNRRKTTEHTIKATEKKQG